MKSPIKLSLRYMVGSFKQNNRNAICPFYSMMIWHLTLDKITYKEMICKYNINDNIEIFTAIEPIVGKPNVQKCKGDGMLTTLHCSM